MKEPERVASDRVAYTHEDQEIKNCLYLLKRACQLNYVHFDKIENFIFGDEYRPESRI